jgi:hypothetical protein
VFHTFWNPDLPVTLAGGELENPSWITRMQTAEEYLKYADECERLARNGPPDHRETLMKIANAWRELAINAEKRNKNTPASVDGD